MTAIEFLNYVNIIFIWGLALSQVYIVSRMKFSFYTCFGRRLFYGDKTCIAWLMQHKYFIWSFILIIVLIVLSLGLLSQAYSGMIRIRTELTVSTSICLWLVLCPLILSLFFKAQQNEN